MRSILISIQPKWCAKIASGEKTVEIRKTKPKIETPFKVYIYCTRPKRWFKYSSCGCASDESLWLSDGKVEMCDGFKYWCDGGDYTNLNGKVIGEFVCDTFVVDKTFGHDPLFLAAACMDVTEAAAYCTNPVMYGWHISNLTIYGKPKPLADFYNECPGLDNTGMCYECENAVGEECDCALNGRLHLTRPPQSWCYVEDVAKDGS